jgi:hypothetical protein
VIESVSDVLPALVDGYGAAAATFSADWYDDLREERGVRGRFTAIPADIADTGTFALLGGRKPKPQSLDALKVIQGGTQRRIANFSRQTVTLSSVEDPRARGWQRIGAGDCDFCAMLIGRGAVYTEASADFEAHDHCNCGAEPAWR